MSPRVHGVWQAHAGEMIYSLHIRQFVRDWRPRFGQYLTHINGTHKSMRSVRSLFPPWMGRQIRRFPEGHQFADRRSLCDEHSPLPLLMLFDSPESRAEAERRWLSNRLAGLRSLLGLNSMKLRLHPVCLKYCPTCRHADLDRLVPPLPYWRIVDQLPSVFVCPICLSPLADGCEICSGPEWSDLAVNFPGRCSCGETVQPRLVKPPFVASHATLVSLARWTSDAVGHVERLGGLDKFASFWRALRAALVTLCRESVTRKSFYETASAKYDPSLLNYFSIRPVLGHSKKDSGFVISRARAAAAFAKLILASVAFPSLHDFEANLILASQGSLRDGELRVESWRRRHEWNVGHSDTTVRRAAIAKGSVKSRRHDVPIPFRQRIVEMLRSGEEKAGIAATFGISRRVVERCCRDTVGLQARWERASWLRYRNFHRATFKECSLLPLPLDADVKRKISTARSWLGLHDAAWMVKARVGLRHKRPPQKGRANTSSLPSVDWKSRDKELCKWLAKRHREVLKQPPPHRLTIRRLLSGHPMLSAYYRCPDRFPQSSKVIQSAIESFDAYCKRVLRDFAAGNGARVPTPSKRVVMASTILGCKAVRTYWPYLQGLLSLKQANAAV
jgi:hypothetical protein